MGYEQAGWNAEETFRCDEDTWDGVEAKGVDGGGDRFGLRMVFEERSRSEGLSERIWLDINSIRRFERRLGGS